MRSRYQNITWILFLLLLLAGCGLQWVPEPGNPLEPQAIVIATPTPMNVQLEVVTAELYDTLTLATPEVLPAGENEEPLFDQLALQTEALDGKFVVATVLVQNTGPAPLDLCLSEFYLEDTDTQLYARTAEAEFYLALLEYPLFPDRPIPPGATARGTLAFDVAHTYRPPLTLVARGLGESGELRSAPFHTN